MYIELIAPHVDAGKRYHEDTVVARTLVSMKYAKRLDDPNEVPQGSTVIPCISTPQWAVVRHATNAEILVMRKYMFETTWWSNPPRDCPESVAAEWRAKTGQQSLRDKANAVVRNIVDR